MSHLIVRDHSQRCEHGFTSPHQTWDVYWCPGGREIVFREEIQHAEAGRHVCHQYGCRNIYIMED